MMIMVAHGHCGSREAYRDKQRKDEREQADIVEWGEKGDGWMIQSPRPRGPNTL
ncbi:hypothetical protein FKP32DRAFT_1594986, partial [Trametes sanguinea]